MINRFYLNESFQNPMIMLCLHCCFTESEIKKTYSYSSLGPRLLVTLFICHEKIMISIRQSENPNRRFKIFSLVSFIREVMLNTCTLDYWVTRLVFHHHQKNQPHLTASTPWLRVLTALTQGM